MAFENAISKFYNIIENTKRIDHNKIDLALRILRESKSEIDGLIQQIINLKDNYNKKTEDLGIQLKDSHDKHAKLAKIETSLKHSVTEYENKIDYSQSCIMKLKRRGEDLEKEMKDISNEYLKEENKRWGLLSIISGGIDIAGFAVGGDWKKLIPGYSICEGLGSLMFENQREKKESLKENFNELTDLAEASFKFTKMKNNFQAELRSVRKDKELTEENIRIFDEEIKENGRKSTELKNVVKQLNILSSRLVNSNLMLTELENIDMKSEIIVPLEIQYNYLLNIKKSVQNTQITSPEVQNKITKIIKLYEQSERQIRQSVQVEENKQEEELEAYRFLRSLIHKL
jgi:DNA repair exonuclease SbcCD ATPase subunit